MQQCAPPAALLHIAAAVPARQHCEAQHGFAAALLSVSLRSFCRTQSPAEYSFCLNVRVAALCLC